MQLKVYQLRSLATLTRYFRQAIAHDAKTAFILETERPYREVSGLAGMPYLCLRVPTGGGKTLMACHTVPIAAREFLQAERALCLWLVPSNIIRDQTLAALKDRRHPYRQALDAAFAGNVAILELAEALYVTPATLTGATTILVSTLAALRVEDTDGRKVYESNGQLMPHFTGLDDAARTRLDREGDGRVIYSLANVLRLRRPMIVMDEAHNARTPLSFDTLARFTPSCVLEFTATPETDHNPTQKIFASNVLCHVSARELKEADMIKLPIKLHTRSHDWKQVLSDALAKREELEALAKAAEREGAAYLRPIVLVQAQPRRKGQETLTVDVVKKVLQEDFKVAGEQIAIATGETRALDEVDLFDHQCPIRVIITVQALREGWDCSFAYILCTLAEQHSAKSVEQILGRVLRLPRAQRQARPELNVAYAYALSASFVATAGALQDALIENGFQEMEAKDFVVGDRAMQPTFDEGTLFGTVEEILSTAPDLSGLEPEVRQRVIFHERTSTLSFTGIMNEADEAALKKCFKAKADQQAVARLRARSQGKKSAAIEAEQPPFRVPWLAIRVEGELELFDDSHFLPATWDLAKCDATMTETDLPTAWTGGTAGNIDVTQAGKIELTDFTRSLHEQLRLLAGESGWDLIALVRWLDRNIPHHDLVQHQSSLFIHNAVSSLVERRGVSVAQLARVKYRLRQALEDKIAALRAEQSKKEFQGFLSGLQAEDLVVDPAYYFTLTEEDYNPNWYCDKSGVFRRHQFGYVGELKSEGEEFDCALHIDQLPGVERWVRNLVRSDSSFSLPTATDRFYPDFIALLKDGRVLIVEYKGKHLWKDAEGDRTIGELWAARSCGRCVFVMVTERQWGMIDEAIAPRG